MTKLKVLHDNMAVKPSKLTSDDRGHLIQLLSNPDKIISGEVHGAGPGKLLDNGKFEPMPYSIGDDVFYPVECEKTAPRFKHEGVEYLVLKADQVVCYRPATSKGQLVDE